MNRNKIVELFGLNCAADLNFADAVREQKCPFTGKICTKMRKSDPTTKIGTCTVRYGNEGIIICPHRLLEHNQIFIDCLHLLSLHEPGNELYLVPEVGIPGGNVDYFLVSAKNKKVKDFIGIELQTLDTTGTVWPDRQRFLYSKGVIDNCIDVLNLSTYGMNWKMTLKTILVQMHHKSETFEHLNKHLVLIIQDPLYRHMLKDFDFSEIKGVRNGDTVHIHSYNLNPELQLSLSNRLSTDSAGIAKCLGLNANANVEMEDMVKSLEPKLIDSNRLRIVA